MKKNLQLNFNDGKISFGSQGQRSQSKVSWTHSLSPGERREHPWREALQRNTAQFMETNKQRARGSEGQAQRGRGGGEGGLHGHTPRSAPANQTPPPGFISSPNVIELRWNQTVTSSNYIITKLWSCRAVASPWKLEPLWANHFLKFTQQTRSTTMRCWKTYCTKTQPVNMWQMALTKWKFQLSTVSVEKSSLTVTHVVRQFHHCFTLALTLLS